MRAHYAKHLYTHGKRIGRYTVAFFGLDKGPRPTSAVILSRNLAGDVFEVGRLYGADAAELFADVRNCRDHNIGEALLTEYASAFTTHHGGK